MNKIIKILFLFVFMCTVSLYVQIDTTKQDSLKTKKSIEKIVPAKLPTNWSKIKDLFL